jgi:hypothetical protein
VEPEPGHAGITLEAQATVFVIANRQLTHWAPAGDAVENTVNLESKLSPRFFPPMNPSFSPGYA